MVRGAPPPIEIAAGLDDHVLGTDAARVKEAIDRVASPDGVLVIMDLGSAVLSAELALELRGDDAGDCRVVLSDAPLVEGLVAAVTLAAAGAPLAEVAADAGQAGHIKTALLNLGNPEPGSPAHGAEPHTAVAGIELAIHNEHGLHARPAARFVETVRRFDAEVTVRNLTQAGPTVSGRSVSALSTLGALASHHIHVAASGRQAREALAAVAALVRRNFDESVARGTPTVGVELGSGPVGASPGIGIGPKTALTPAALDDAADSPPASPEAERDRLLEAIEETRAELTATRDQVTGTAGRAEAEIFTAHLLLLDDDELVGPAMSTHRPRDGHRPAGVATSRGRAGGEVRGARRSVPAGPGRRRSRRRRPRARSSGRRDDVSRRRRRRHPRRLRPPARAGGHTRPGEGRRHRHRLWHAGLPRRHPRPVARHPGRRRRRRRGARRARRHDHPGRRVRRCRHHRSCAGRLRPVLASGPRTNGCEPTTCSPAAPRPAITTDGTRIDVVANVASLDDAVLAVRHGADGVGLLRTEFLFLDRAEPPDEDEQLDIYSSIADALEGRRLTIRTLDVGGDKPVPYLRVPPAKRTPSWAAGGSGSASVIRSCSRRSCGRSCGSGCSTRSPSSSRWSRPSTSFGPPARCSRR